MRGSEVLRLAAGAVLAHRLRSALTVLGIVIGVASVVLLTAMGEGARASIVSEFSQFGTNTLVVVPGKVRTGGIAGAVGGGIRPLTVDDAEAMERVPGVEKVVPVCMGMARVSAGSRGRSVFVYGATAGGPDVWKFRVRVGRFLPPGDVRRAAPVAVLGPKLKRELFGDANALGERVRIGEFRFVVIGEMAPVGQFLGLTLDDAAYVPIASAQQLFNLSRLTEIDALFSPRVPPGPVVDGVRRALASRREGEEDFTVLSQTEMLSAFDRVLAVVSGAVTGIAGISLVVGAIGILTMMWISVGERSAEIGLLKALGARPPEIRALFLAEAALLSAAGCLLGLLAGAGLGALIHVAVPGLPLRVPLPFVAAALAVSVGVGLASGVLPARRAAALDPIEVLRAE